MNANNYDRTTRAGFLARWTMLIALAHSTLGAVAADPKPNAPIKMPELKAAARITRDSSGIAHIRAQNHQDLMFLQGYVHAQDRLFQMDVNRRLASGTLAELLGEGALAQDVQLRTIGLRRAAERSLAVQSPAVQAALEAYANGVNAFVRFNPLPLEYAALELTRFEPWTPVDSLTVAKVIAFQRSFDIDIEPTITLLTYQQAGQVLGFDGAALFFEDLFRSAPFDPTVTVPEASFAATQPRYLMSGSVQRNQISPRASAPLHPATLRLAREYLDRIKRLPAFRDVLDRDKHAGSNEWGVSGAHTTTGNPMLANDTHLPLGVPNLFHPIHLQGGKINAAGSSVAGVPFVILGQNRKISWGATVSYADVTDTFQEQIVPDANSPSGLSIVHQGQKEPVIPIPQVFRKNNFDGVPDNLSLIPPGGAIPPVTLIVPRRNNGPIVNLDLAHGIALSVQYTGFSPTRELEAFLIWNEAKDLADFEHGLQFFDVGSINWAYSDVHGNIAMFSSSEVPVREDLQAGAVNGLPPAFIRQGAGGNDWLPVQHPQPGQAIAYEILPFEEMPKAINPPAGWFVNANNDPLGHTLDNNPLNQLRPGGGIFYLSSFYEGYRAGRITRLIQDKLSAGGKISFADMRQIQSDTVLVDAEVFVPHIVRAFANARSSAEPALAALAVNPGVAEAVLRLGAWNFTTPTGIPEGYDASDEDGVLSAPSNDEITASAAATIYSVWRGQFIRNTIDAPLTLFGLPVGASGDASVADQFAVAAVRNLLERFPTAGGVGASGINFFNVPGVGSANDRRDILILKSLADSLELLAGDRFAPAFGHSTNLDDYRWGKLHRLVLNHPLGGPFNIPPAAGLWPGPLAGLDGIPADGGFSTVDVGNPVGGVRADSADGFMFDHGAAHRLITEGTPGGMRAELGIPGAASGVLGSANYFNLLPGWLSNDGFALLTRSSEIHKEAASSVKFEPAKARPEKQPKGK
jgi:penicillin amidase